MRKRDIAMYGVALVLAFVVGALVGQSCEPPTDAPARGTTIVATCEPTKEVVYECPPDVGSASAKPEHRDGEPGEPRQASKSKQLPKSEPSITPRERKRLLAWVRDQSVDLEGCRSTAKDTYRLSVTLELNDDHAIEEVKLNAPRSELPSNVAACLRERMRRWSPPTDLVTGRQSLVFGLTL